MLKYFFELLNFTKSLRFDYWQFCFDLDVWKHGWIDHAFDHQEWYIFQATYLPFPWNPYLRTEPTSLVFLFLVKNFQEKEIEFLKERFFQKLPSNDGNNWAYVGMIGCIIL